MPDPYGFEADAQAAREAFDALAAENAVAAARTIEAAFERAGEAMEHSLVRAARAGELAFERMAQSILQSLARLAVDRLIEGPIAAVLSSLPLIGQRADGGPVLPGSAYLVGERGPELFTPAVSGAIHPAPAPQVTVNVNIGPGADPGELARSQGQIATMIARAVAQGQKRL